MPVYAGRTGSRAPVNFTLGSRLHAEHASGLPRNAFRKLYQRATLLWTRPSGLPHGYSPPSGSPAVILARGGPQDAPNLEAHVLLVAPRDLSVTEVRSEGVTGSTVLTDYRSDRQNLVHGAVFGHYHGWLGSRVGSYAGFRLGALAGGRYAFYAKRTNAAGSVVSAPVNAYVRRPPALGPLSAVAVDGGFRVEWAGADLGSPATPAAVSIVRGGGALSLTSFTAAAGEFLVNRSGARSGTVTRVSVTIDNADARPVDPGQILGGSGGSVTREISLTWP